MVFKNSQHNSVSENANTDIVVWDDKYKCGIALVDTQHRELIKLTNQLYRACFGGNEAANNAFSEAMSRMVEYVRFHFSTEQEMLKRINYPDYQDHKAKHDVLIKDILHAAEEYKMGKKFVPNQFVRTLKDWIFSHIAITDKLYAYYIAEQKKKGLLSDQQINGLTSIKSVK